MSTHKKAHVQMKLLLIIQRSRMQEDASEYTPVGAVRACARARACVCVCVCHVSHTSISLAVTLCSPCNPNTSSMRSYCSGWDASVSFSHTPVSACAHTHTHTDAHAETHTHTHPFEYKHVYGLVYHATHSLLNDMTRVMTLHDIAGAELACTSPHVLVLGTERTCQYLAQTH